MIWFWMACLVAAVAVLAGRFAARRRRGEVESVRSFLRLERGRAAAVGILLLVGLPWSFDPGVRTLAFAIGYGAAFLILLIVLIVNAVRTGPDHGPRR